MATRDPFLPWKHAQRVWTEAKRRGFEVVVALDDRTGVADTLKVSEFADQVVRWTSDGHAEDAFGYISMCSGEFAFLLADDEEPSPLCWEFATHPPFQARFGIPVIPYVTKMDKTWAGDYGVQERLVWKKSWRWIKRRLPDGSLTTFEGHSEGAQQVTIKDNPGAVIWHYLLDAPLEEREEKARRYARIDQSSVDYHRVRLLRADHPHLLQTIPQSLRPQLTEGV